MGTLASRQLRREGRERERERERERDEGIGQSEQNITERKGEIKETSKQKKTELKGEKENASKSGGGGFCKSA